MSDEFALLLNISQNKWTLEEGDVGQGRLVLHCSRRSGRGPAWERSLLASPWSRSCSHSLGTEVPETLNQLCFIHFIQKGSFKIQLRNHGQAAVKDREGELADVAEGSSAGFYNLWPHSCGKDLPQSTK